MKNLKLSTLAASMVLALGANAATHDLGVTAAQKIATEIDINATTGTVIDNQLFGNGTDDITFDITDSYVNNGANNSQVTRYYRIDLDNGAKFEGAAAIDFNVAVADSTITMEINGAGLSYAVYRLVFDVSGNGTGAGADIPATTQIDVNLGTGIRVYNQNTVTATVTSHATLSDAVNDASVITTGKSDDIIAFSDGLVFSSSKTSGAALDLIDVTEDSKFLTSGTTTGAQNTVLDLGDVDLDEQSDVFNIDGTVIQDEDIIATTATSTVRVTGDLTATAGVTNGVALTTFVDTDYGVFLNATDGAAGVCGTAADTRTQSTRLTTATDGSYAEIAASNQSAIITSGVFNNNATATTDTAVCVIYNGVSQIQEVSDGFTFSTSLTDLATTTYKATTSATLASLAKNGSTATANFALKPRSEGGAYDSWVRITNPSTVQGDVSMTVTDDDGTAVSFPISQNGMVASATLGARSSTSQINLDDVWAAANSAGVTSVAAGSVAGLTAGKLKISVTGEFTGVHLDVYGQTQGGDGLFILE